MIPNEIPLQDFRCENSFIHSLYFFSSHCSLQRSVSSWVACLFTQAPITNGAIIFLGDVIQSQLTNFHIILGMN